MNPWTEDPPPTTSQAPGGSHDINTDSAHWWNKIEEDSTSKPDEEEGITFPDPAANIPTVAEAPTAKAWNKPRETVHTPFNGWPTTPDCFPLATAGHGQ